MLVAGAAALLVGQGDALVQGFQAKGHTVIQSDPIRIVEATITGISFVGAGPIFRLARTQQVEGLTTAALLLSGAIGISVSLRQFVIAFGATVLTIRGPARFEVNRETHSPAATIGDGIGADIPELTVFEVRCLASDRDAEVA